MSVWKQLSDVGKKRSTLPLRSEGLKIIQSQKVFHGHLLTLDKIGDYVRRWEKEKKKIRQCTSGVMAKAV